MAVDDPAVRAALAAANANDTAAFLDCFVPGGVVDDWGREFRGRDEIHRWSDAEFIGKRVSLDVTDVHASPGRVVVIATVGGDGFNGPSTFTFETAQSKVAKMTIRA